MGSCNLGDLARLDIFLARMTRTNDPRLSTADSTERYRHRTQVTERSSYSRFQTVGSQHLECTLYTRDRRLMSTGQLCTGRVGILSLACIPSHSQRPRTCRNHRRSRRCLTLCCSVQTQSFRAGKQYTRCNFAELKLYLGRTAKGPSGTLAAPDRSYRFQSRLGTARMRTLCKLYHPNRGNPLQMPMSARVNSVLPDHTRAPKARSARRAIGALTVRGVSESRRLILEIDITSLWRLTKLQSCLLL